MNELHKRLKSFTYAWKGVCSFLSKEHNAWIHCAAIIAVTIAGIRFEITRTEWLVILLCFAMVLAAEAFNTAIERLVNLVSPDYHPIAGDVKDIAAGSRTDLRYLCRPHRVDYLCPLFLKVLIYHLFH